MRVPLLAFVATVAVALPVMAQQPLKVVPTLDLQKYAGRWYEVARLPNRFENDCASDITAEYAIRPDGRITVTNRCRQANGEMKVAEGVARRVQGQPPSVLKVRFAPAFLSFLPMVWGDYQVISLAPDYSHALVGSPDRQYLWILARTPRPQDAVYQQLLADARAQGFDVGPLIRPPHGGT